MTRHFLGLYLLIVLAIAGVSWGQDRLWLAFSNQSATYDKSLATTLVFIEHELQSKPEDQWGSYIASFANTTLDVDLLDISDISGFETMSKLDRGEITFMQGAHSESWLLKRLSNSKVLALQQKDPAAQRGALEWALALLFYAVIALVLMIWLWPLTRDLRALEKATATFGDRNWLFQAAIKPRSQIYPLAQTFRKMAARIDGLIGSHKDMSNAVAHEIKTPLTRMQFEIEMAQDASNEQVKVHLQNIKADIGNLNSLVAATLDYAILERADMALNIAAHDFTKLIPGVADYVRRDARPELAIFCNVAATATQVICDAHLMEAILKNLLYNASRYASSSIRICFTNDANCYCLTVDDDGPGIPDLDRQRVFGSFVQLGQPSDKKKGFGLGLAIVKRAIEWHGGQVNVGRSTLGGASFTLSWPRPEHLT